MAYNHMVVIILSQKIHCYPQYSIPIIIIDCITFNWPNTNVSIVVIITIIQFYITIMKNGQIIDLRIWRLIGDRRKQLWSIDRSFSRIFIPLAYMV